MCGIAGLRDEKHGPEALNQACQTMCHAIRHRGPDGDGVLVDARHHVALGQRRLAIVDLSPAGAQPMTSHDGRYVLVYNGEVYDYEILRADPALAHVSWNGHSDTEVILESIAAIGLEPTLARLNGMYAFALWDRHLKELTLVRDPLGIKPLFYIRNGRNWAFASELKALSAAGLTDGIDPAAIGSFLRYGYVPCPQSIYQNIEKVAPGEIVRLSGNGDISKTTYFSLPDLVQTQLQRPLDLDDHAATDRLEQLLKEAVASQMVADVDVGAFLSGGIDSSTVAAMMVQADRGAVRTYSIGFPEFGFDESEAAAIIAGHLGTQHQSMTVTGQEALDVIPSLPDLFDEPFADSSQIPTYLLSKMTRQHVTVALSGDGGDELFGGYNRYLWATRHWPRLSGIPRAVHRLAAAGLNAVPGAVWDTAERMLPGLPPQTSSKVHKFAQVLGLSEAEVYRFLTSQIQDPSRFTSHTGTSHELAPWGTSSLMNNMRLADTMTYMPDDVLQKVDRSSMAASLEARPVLLDKRLLTFAWSLPENMLIRGGETKWLLRQVLRRHVPDHLFDRPKMGFGVPLAAWLRGPLKTWAGDLLHDPDLGGGHLNPSAAQALYREHLDQKADHSHALWNILSFAVWYTRWHGQSHPA